MPKDHQRAQWAVAEISRCVANKLGVKNNEVEHGITIHEITPGIDDGPIVGQLKYSIYPQFDEVVDVYRRSLEYGWILFQQTIPLPGRDRRTAAGS